MQLLTRVDLRSERGMTLPELITTLSIAMILSLATFALVDTTLRPVLGELGARLPVAGISVLESELGRVDEVFDAWWSTHGSSLRRSLRDNHRQEVTSC